MPRLRFDPWSGHIQEATSDWEGGKAKKKKLYNKTRLSKKRKKGVKPKCWQWEKGRKWENEHRRFRGTCWLTFVKPPGEKWLTFEPKTATGSAQQRSPEPLPPSRSHELCWVLGLQRWVRHYRPHTLGWNSWRRKARKQLPLQFEVNRCLAIRGAIFRWAWMHKLQEPAILRRGHGGLGVQGAKRISSARTNDGARQMWKV